MALNTGQVVIGVVLRKEKEKIHKIEHQWYDLLHHNTMMATYTSTYQLNSSKNTNQIFVMMDLSREKERLNINDTIYTCTL